MEKWLESLHLGQYLDTFVSHKYNTMLRVIKLWELELNTVCESEPCVMCVTLECHSEVLGVELSRVCESEPVSYTHLTLPTTSLV